MIPWFFGNFLLDLVGSYAPHPHLEDVYLVDIMFDEIASVRDGFSHPSYEHGAPE